MTRLPLDMAADVCGVERGTIRRWVFDGYVHRYWDGYDIDELLARRDGRSLPGLAARAGVKHPERVGVSHGGPQTRV